MPGHFRSLSSDVFIYGLGRMAVQMLSFITLPIFTRIFSVEDYGVIETIGTLTAIIGIFASLSLEAASQRSYFDYRSEEISARQTVLSTTFWTLLLWSSGLAILLGFASRPLGQWLFGSPRYGLVLLIALLTIPINTLANFLQEILRLWHQPLRYSLLALMIGTVSVGLALYLVAIRRWGLLGNYVGLLVGSAGGIFLGLMLVGGAVRRCFDGRELRVMLAYGLPLLPVAASNWIMQWIDRFFLLRYAPLAEVGLYGLGVRLSNLLLLGVAAFGLAWAPFILALYSRDPAQEKEVRAKTLTRVALLLSFGAVGISVFAREFFLTITAPSFEDAYKVVGLLSGSIVAMGINSVTITGISLARRTIYFTQYTLIAAALNIGLNFLLIPPWGMVGAALATLLTYATLSLLYYWRAQVLDPVPYNARQVCFIFGVAGGLIALGTFIRLNPIWLGIAAKAALLIAFPLLMWHLGIIDSQSREYLRNRAQLALRRWGIERESR